MSIKRINPGPRMSQAVVFGDMVYLSGQVGNLGDDVAAQTKTILDNVDALLAEAGTNKSNVLKAEIWLSDMAHFGAMNRVWDAWIDPANPPARATGESKLAAPEFFVEIMITAAKI
ncbi:RidA family protein [Maritalea porphyrae]|jgi:enamine deaminase RidA (YjgF/YER057c/UK114 family)|uniref:RidA family protein n=1 Tax=Maritalea porphyrae TaxID=880732 RepID=UPI0022B06CB0|nr:RidA family protein [Maritalea porphyrae]MCZ4272542.1 RidA family protein [Maritalea porphyrae]